MPKKMPGDWSTGPSNEYGLRTLRFTDADGASKSIPNLTQEEIDQELAKLNIRILSAANSKPMQNPPEKDPMSREEYQEFLENTLDRIKVVMRQKNADYTGGDSSPFANFMVSEQLGLADARIGLLIRMVDKIQRLKTFISKGELQVKNEGAEDAAMDIVGYGLLLMGMIEDAKRQNSNK